mmetsp:Transcript_12983/g.30872  ORF Transcript_12983/g.30872 Transcript_12983/m.30872 type:complete len:190 (+) Transcript_12983:91-660(+)
MGCGASLHPGGVAAGSHRQSFAKVVPGDADCSMAKVNRFKKGLASAPTTEKKSPTAQDIAAEETSASGSETGMDGVQGGNPRVQSKVSFTFGAGPRSRRGDDPPKAWSDPSLRFEVDDVEQDVHHYSSWVGVPRGGLPPGTPLPPDRSVHELHLNSLDQLQHYVGRKPKVLERIVNRRRMAADEELSDF